MSYPFVIGLALLASTPAFAEERLKFPVSIPQECVELALREGAPVVIESKYQATRARIQLARLSGRDPLVRDCRAAIERYKAAGAAQR